MASPLKGVPKAVRQALKGVFFLLTYRVTTSTAVKTGAAYAIGVSTINLSTWPAGSTGVVPGDTFLNIGNVHTVTNTVAPVSGVCAGVQFTPALTTAMTSGQAVTVSHNTDTPIRALDRQVDVSFITNTVISANDYLFTLLADSLPVTPKLTDHIQTRDGKWLSIISTAYDAAKATWTVQARG